ncbi:histidine kinase [Sphingomonas antarctica]|uniref:PAS-domain containing protein n=1 Tax=Sphingomonas antarctica TaxID=2040274 RepID=UPI0039EA6D8C
MQSTILAAALGLWLAVAACALAAGLILRRRARGALAGVARQDSLADLSPALALIVHGDNRIEGSTRLAMLLGFDRIPATLAALEAQDAGLSSGDAAALAADVSGARQGGKSFMRPVVPVGSQRTLFMIGQPAPRTVAARGVLVWVIDATRNQGEMAQLRHDADRAGQAFRTLSRLIEAAPVPMWHRGPDLRLTLVNRAYVDAVDAVDAEDAVKRGVELVEGSAGIGPIAAAAAARDAGEVRQRIVPAIIGGARRAMRIVDVPLGQAGVAGYAIDTDDLERARADFRRFVDTQRDTLDRLSAGVAQFDADHTLSFSNLPFQRMFALRPEWLADRPEFDRVLDRLREAGRIPEARDFPAWKREKRDWFTNLAGAAEESWLLPDGKHLRVVAQPLPDAGLLVIFEDRTEQVQLLSARDTLIRVREATFDNLFEAVGTFAADGRLNLWNSRFRDVWQLDDDFLASFPRIDALAEAAAPLIASEGGATTIREAVRAATMERHARTGRISLTDGRHFEYSGVPLPDGNALLIMLDVTDRHRVETVLRERADSLEASDKERTAFVANMSYELRQPLTSIAGFGEMLEGGYAGNLGARAQEYVAAILEAVRRLSVQVDQVLAVAEQDAGLGQEVAVIEIGPLLRKLADKHGLKCTMPDSIGGVAASAEAVMQSVEKVIASIGGGAAQLAVTTGNGVRVAIAGAPAGTLPGEDVLIDLRAMMAEHRGSIAVARRAHDVPVVTLSFPR